MFVGSYLLLHCCFHTVLKCLQILHLTSLVHDLLSSTLLLQLREDVKRGMHVENLTEHVVSNAREAMQQLIEVSVQIIA